MLVTNDNGVDSPGIRARALERAYDVTVARTHGQSGRNRPERVGPLTTG